MKLFRRGNIEDIKGAREFDDFWGEGLRRKHKNFPDKHRIASGILP